MFGYRDYQLTTRIAFIFKMYYWELLHCTITHRPILHKHLYIQEKYKINTNKCNTVYTIYHGNYYKNVITTAINIINIINNPYIKSMAGYSSLNLQKIIRLKTLFLSYIINLFTLKCIMFKDNDKINKLTLIWHITGPRKQIHDTKYPTKSL